MGMKQRQVFEKHWEYQLGSQMLKTKNEGLRWKKAIAKYFYELGHRDGSKSKGDPAEDRVVKSLTDAADELDALLKIHKEKINAKEI